MAEDLQRTKLSEFLEAHVRNKMETHIESEAKKTSEAKGITIEEAKKQVQLGGAITIRQVTSMDKKLEVRDRMKKRYAFKNYPEEFSYRCKCIVVFQNLDGVDVILFGLYVYEHDEKNPAPNSRAVYVSYLDSVHYMRPRQMRTFIYHEILISYLDYVRRRGFATAHIWACPPLKGDDYILYAKPEDQKTPKDDRLRQWYIDMLVKTQQRGIVGKVTNMYDLYFANKKNDATVVPYMDGDYFPAEAENIIKNIEEGQAGKKGSTQSQKKKKGDKNKKKKSGRGGTRSSGIDEEALKTSGIMQVGKDQKSLEEGGRDYVMTKLGETIQPMKESFIVAYLAWEGANEEDMVVPKETEEYREKHGITTDWKAEQEKEDESKTDSNSPDEATSAPKPAADVVKSEEKDGDKEAAKEDDTDETKDEEEKGDKMDVDEKEDEEANTKATDEEEKEEKEEDGDKESSKASDNEKEDIAETSENEEEKEGEKEVEKAAEKGEEKDSVDTATEDKKDEEEKKSPEAPDGDEEEETKDSDEGEEKDSEKSSEVEETPAESSTSKDEADGDKMDVDEAKSDDTAAKEEEAPEEKKDGEPAVPVAAPSSTSEGESAAVEAAEDSKAEAHTAPSTADAPTSSETKPEE